jgi:hypothetical protein
MWISEHQIVPHMLARGVSLRKLKSANTKLAFGALLNGPSSPDWRFKLLAQYNLEVSEVPVNAQRFTTRVLQHTPSPVSVAADHGKPMIVALGTRQVLGPHQCVVWC